MPTRNLSRLLFGLVAMALAASLQQTFPQAPAPVQCAANLQPAELDAKIDALIQQMTPAERVAQLQDRAPAIPRLAIPAYNWWNEGLHGIARNGYATVFPQAIGLAATWDANLLREAGDVVSTEARAKFNGHQSGDSLRYAGLTIWSPNINIFRDPRWGRGQETYGEDPYLTGLLGSAFVRGIQGQPTGFYRKADATPKHFAVHSGPESIRDGFNSVVSQHDLADTYTPAFRAVAGSEGAGASALMCSYNAINGVPACANPLLQRRVRASWGFNGYIVSDCDAIGEITDYLHYTADEAHGAAAALKAGVDLDCGGTYAHLNEALDQHLITLADVDRSLHRLLLERMRLGMLQPASCSKWSSIAAADVDTPAARATALKAAEESFVLLRNDHQTLPLNLKGKRIAVIGPTADLLQVIEANYHGAAPHPKTLLDGFAESFRSNVKVQYAQGSTLAEGVMVPISMTALRPTPENHSVSGLTAQYFNNPDLAGQPTLTRIDPRIDFDINRAAPAEGLGNAYSIRWTGALVPPGPGKYRLRVNIERCWDCTRHDGYTLSIDGKVVLEDDGSPAKDPRPDTVNLDEPNTQPHALKLELRHTGDDEGIRLDWEAPANVQLAQALDAARQADVVVAIVGLSPDLEGEALKIKVPGFNGGDRVALGLPQPQQTLLRALGKLGKPLVMVVTSGSAVALGEEVSGVGAILDAWYPGEEGGHALAQLLTGAANPSGRLPVTIYRSAEDLPAFTDYSMAHRTYRYYDGPVQYPFGFGLSYTQFAYSEPKLSSNAIKAGDTLEITATVRNTGKLSGDEVAELYLIPSAASGMPRLALQGVQRLHLPAGKSAVAHLTLTPRQLSFVDAEGERAIRAGQYRVFLGGAQPNDPQHAGTPFEITGDLALNP